MALSRLLLLCMLASEVRYAETKPIDFVCSRSARRAMNIGTEMETALNNCNSSAILPAPVQIPCTELHVASWERKSHHERRQDISASLKPLLESIKVARSLDQAECGSVLLQKLEHNINSYLLILTHLQLSVRGRQGPEGASGELRTVLCSSKHPQSEHSLAELQASDHRQTGTVDDEFRKHLCSSETRRTSVNPLFITFESSIHQ
ncbi:thrombopoietin isoform X1 [Corythoichthys intestinalis]|uniref:thrombopoietin isoform X1 n=1 Tax=Corythoichthys intestinalis TaxID=161448 RepID=UPI0025A50E2D|nr:thrombopoietin isoform X1 [Corythoichthys intestinalis]